MSVNEKVIFIVGPTAVGKSDISFHLAQRCGGEIVSCDSMQIYKEITIASNKPDQAAFEAIPHHLVNIISVEENFDVVQFQKRALVAIQEVHQRDHIPVVIGGSGMYIEILLDGIFPGSPKDEVLREKLMQQERDEEDGYLYEQLKSKDPLAASKIHSNDINRIIRALEVMHTEKKPISQLQKDRQGGIWEKYDVRLFGLNQDRKVLYQRINDRVEEMFTRGVVEEIRKISTCKLSGTAQRIIGIKEIQGFLNGEYDQERSKYLMKLNTRHLAKRQLTWFYRDKRIEWFGIDEDNTLEQIVGQIVQKIRGGRNIGQQNRY